MVSDDCKDLIKKMLVRDPIRRITATQVLQHKWFEVFDGQHSVAKEKDELDPEVYLRMKSYKSTSYFEQAALNILIKQGTDAEFAKLKEQFEAIDTDNSGLIDTKELKDYIVKMGDKVDNDQINTLMSELDYAGNGQINYSEFLAATIDAKTFFDDTRLRVVFTMFDVTNSKEITA